MSPLVPSDMAFPTPNKFAHCAHEPAAKRSAAFRLQRHAPRDGRLSSLKAALRETVHGQGKGTSEKSHSLRNYRCWLGTNGLGSLA